MNRIPILGGARLVRPGALVALAASLACLLHPAPAAALEIGLLRRFVPVYKVQPAGPPSDQPAVEPTSVTKGAYGLDLMFGLGELGDLGGFWPGIGFGFTSISDSGYSYHAELVLDTPELTLGPSWALFGISVGGAFSYSGFSNSDVSYALDVPAAWNAAARLNAGLTFFRTFALAGRGTSVLWTSEGARKDGAKGFSYGHEFTLETAALYGVGPGMGLGVKYARTSLLGEQLQDFVIDYQWGGDASSLQRTLDLGFGMGLTWCLLWHKDSIKKEDSSNRDSLWELYVSTYFRTSDDEDSGSLELRLPLFPYLKVNDLKNGASEQSYYLYVPQLRFHLPLPVVAPYFGGGMGVALRGDDAHTDRVATALAGLYIPVSWEKDGGMAVRLEYRYLWFSTALPGVKPAGDTELGGHTLGLEILAEF